MSAEQILATGTFLGRKLKIKVFARKHFLFPKIISVTLFMKIIPGYVSRQ
jgi:hypothetical protein